MHLRPHIRLFYASHKNYGSRKYNEALEGDKFTCFANDILKHFKNVNIPSGNEKC